MRPLLALALVLAGPLALSLTLAGAAEARKQRYHYQPRYYQPHYYQPRGYYYGPPRNSYSYERQVCEERAQAADPTGLYAGYPCWAREAFGRSPGGRR